MLNLFSRNLERMVFGCDSSLCIAVGVSGGSDSIALLLLVKKWTSLFGGKVIALSVDHGLRSGSLEDCIFVQNLCKKLSIDCHILSVKWRYMPTSNIQAKAREARYALMTDFCKSLDIVYLCVGHHKDDVAENFLLRLMRSSGIFGLSMRESIFINNVKILRPLLSFKKLDCTQFLLKEGIKWREDPSNSSERFTRSRLRVQLGSILKDDAIIATQKHLQSLSDTIIKDVLLDLMHEYVFISELGYAQVDLDLARNAPKELQYLIISHLLTVIRGIKKVPRLQSVKRAWDNIILLDVSAITLHGCFLTRDLDNIFIIRSFGKDEVQNVRLTDHVLWDKRFLVEWKGQGSEVCFGIERLFIKDLSLLFKSLGQLDCTLKPSLRKRILASLPVIKDEFGEVVCIPQASYYTKSGLCLIGNISVKFHPNFISPLVHFI